MGSSPIVSRIFLSMAFSIERFYFIKSEVDISLHLLKSIFPINISYNILPVNISFIYSVSNALQPCSVLGPGDTTAMKTSLCFQGGNYLVNRHLHLL